MHIGISMSIPSVVKTLSMAVKSLFSRVGAGNAHAYMFSQQTPVLGNELVTNGDFSNGTTGWSLGTGFSVSGGKLVINGGNAGSVFTTSASQLATVVGRTYRIQYDYTLTSGRFRFNPVAGVITTLVTTGSGTYTQDFVATAAGDMFIQAPDAATVGTIDNISVREILSYNDILQGFHTGNYVESTGVTPASVDQPCGLVLDAAGSVGAELVTNGDFSGGLTGWTQNAAATGTATVVGGALSYTTPHGDYAETKQVNGSVVDKTYRVEYDVVSFVSSVTNVTIQFGRATVYNGAISALTVGRKTAVVKSTHSDGFSISVRTDGVIAIDNASAKEITGIHASQSTSGYRPIERRGIVNLLLNSTAPATQTLSLAVGTYTLSLIGTGSVVITGLGAGTLTGTGASDLVTLTFSVAVAGAVIFTKAGSVTSFGLFSGTLTASQILAYGGIPLTTTAAASSSSGPGYLQFDGTDDYLATGIVVTGDFTITVAGKQTVASGATPKAAIGARAAANDRLYLGALNGFHAAVIGNGVVLQSTTPDTQDAVVTLKVSGSTATLYVNGVQAATSSSYGTILPGVGLFIGAVNNAGSPAFHGNRNLYFADVVLSALSDADRILTEKLAAQIAGVTLP